ncbi:MAG TPA: dihydropteroate synthase [Verrucomicrobiales bacterium]|nr:dihydropteroate synthase [Verrucomicrobiales bacterium]
MLSLADLAAIAAEDSAALQAKVREFSVGSRRLKFNSRPAIMGVINLSFDSWYRESVCLNEEMAVRRLEVLHAEGADLVDIGAESTLSHASRVAERRQTQLLTPLLQEARRKRIAVSVETYHAGTARKCLREGAAVINLTRGTGSRKILQQVAEHDAAVILCYVQGTHVRAVGDLKFDRDPVAVMYEYFARQIEAATSLGVRKIFVDPGMGFYYRNLQDSGERIRHQMMTFLRSSRFRKLGFPVCQALPHAFEHFAAEVRCAEPFFAVLAALGRTDLFRTHEVSRTRAVLDTLAVW